MAYTVITRSNQAVAPSNQRQVEIPNYSEGVVALEDTDHHYLIVDGRGKRALTVAVVNETNKDVTVTVYGAHNAIDTPESDQVFELGQDAGDSQFTASATDKNYECYNDPFPFFIIDIYSSAAPDGENVTVLANLLST